VSHNLAAVTRLCERAILVSEGVKQKDGPAPEVAAAYMLSALSRTVERTWPDVASAPGSEIARLRGVRVLTDEGQPAEAMDIRRPVTIEMTFDVLKPGYALAARCELVNHVGLAIFGSHDMKPGWRERPYPCGRFVSTAQIPGNLLAEGTFLVSVGLFSPEPDRNHFHVREAVAFQVVDSLQGDSARGDWAGPMYGAVRPLLEWKTTPVDATSTP
jgi:lipopolysaccharide transport system ATP-binding protein